MRFAAYAFVAFTVAMEAVELGFARGAEQTAFYSTQLYFDSVSLVAQSVVLGLIMFGFEGASELFLTVSVTAGAFSIPLAIAGIVMTGIVGYVMHMQRRSLDAAAMIQRIVDDYRMKMSIQVRNENAVVNFGMVTTDKRLNNAIVTTIDFNDPSTVRYAFGSQRVHKSLDWHEGKFVPFGTEPDPKKTFSLRKALDIPEKQSIYEYELRHARVVDVILPAALESVIDFEYGTAWGMLTRSSQSYPELKVVRQIQSNPQAHWYFEYYSICEMAISKIFVEYLPTVVHINLGIHARYNLFVPSLKPAGRDKLTYNITAAEVDREQHIYVQLQAGVSFNIYRAEGATSHVWELNCTLLSPSLCSPVFSPKDFQVGNVVFHAIPNKVIIVDRAGVLECQFVTRRCERKQELRAPSMQEDWDTNTETDHIVIERSRSCRSLQGLECTRITYPHDPVVEIPTTQTSRFLGMINDGTGVRAFHYNEDTSMLTISKNSVDIPLVFPHGEVSVTRAWVVQDALSVILSDGLQFIISDTFAKYCHTMRVSEGNSLQDVERQIMRLKEYYHMADILRLDLSKLGEEFTHRWQVSYVVRAKEFIVLNRPSNEIFSILGWDSSQGLTWYFAMSSCLGQCTNPRPKLYQMRGYTVPTGSHTGSIRESVSQISQEVARKSVNMHGETLATGYSTGTDVVIITEENPGKMFRITASGDRYLRELDFRDINVREEAPVALWCRADLVETTIRVSGLDRPVWCAPHHNLVVLGPRGTVQERLNGWIDWILVGVTELHIPLLLNSRTGILYVSTEHANADSIRVTRSRTVVSDDDLQWPRIEVHHPSLNKIASAFIVGDTGELMLLDQLGVMYVFHSNSAFARTDGTHITLVGVNNKWMANNVDGMHSSSYSEATVPELHTTIRNMVTTFQEQTPSRSLTANFNVTVSPILTLGPPSLGLWYHTHCDQIIHTMPMPSPDKDCLLAQQLISYSCQTGIAFIYTPRTRIIYKKDATDVTKFLRVDELHLMPKDHSSILIVCSKGERLQDPFELGIDFIFSCSKRSNYHFVQYDEQRITAYDENDVATHHDQSIPLSC